MFFKPMEVPPEANYLPFIWTYILKDDETRKAREPCNGSPRLQCTATLGKTYATISDHTASKIFCAISAEKGHTVIGADAFNAFFRSTGIPCPSIYEFILSVSFMVEF